MTSHPELRGLAGTVNTVPARLFNCGASTLVVRDLGLRHALVL